MTAATPPPLTSWEKELERDALRWRALMASDRIRVMGWAGMPDRMAPGRDMHMGVEFWSDHPAAGDPQYPQDKCRAQVAAYADALIERLPPPSLKQSGGSAAQVPPPLPSTAEAVAAERARCAEIVQLARFGEMDTDFRSIINAIEGGQTIKQIKEPTDV